MKNYNFLNQSDKAASNLDDRSRYLRKQLVEMMQAGGRGHLASALSLVEILRVLYDDILNYDVKNPRSEQRDRFILSKGHGCMGLYIILADKGFFHEHQLWKFCHADGLLGGHPEIGIPGVEASTGSLGHGLSIGIGMALNAKFEGASYRIFVLVGDGESNEGSIWEGAMCAAKHGLSNLTVIIDYNKHQSYGPTSEVLELEPLADKWRSFCFAVSEVDGHDVSALRTVLSNLPIELNKPSVIICHTVKGKGIKSIENDMRWHHKSRITEKEIEALLDDFRI